MDLEYTVTNQVIRKNNRSNPANLSQKYLRLSFTFTEDWDNLTKFALFKVGEDNYRQALDGNKVVVPSLVLKNKKFLFTLYGIDDNDLRVTTNLVKVSLLESGFVHEAIGDDQLDDPNIVEEIYLAIDTKANTSDMVVALDGKSDVGHTHTQSEIRDFPTKVSSFTNDVGYLTEHQSLAEYYLKTEVDNLLDKRDNKILLTGDKSIIQADGTANLTIKAKTDGFPLSEETVELYNGEDMRVKLGEATTNSQGIAVYEYTGIGAGHLQIIAVSGNIQSDIHDLYDVLIVDTGIDPGYTDIWVVNADTSLTRGSEYSTITEASTSSALLKLNTQSTVSNTGVIEFDVYQVDGTSSLTPFFIRSQTGGSNVGSFKLGDLGENVGEWVHIKIVFNTNKAKIYSPNTTDGYEITLSTQYDNYGFAFSTPGALTTLRFKNFMIY